MVAKIYWRLHYRDGGTIDEPEGTLRPGRIFDTRPGAVRIQITEGTPGQPPEGRLGAYSAKLIDPETGHRCAPVFLRKVSLDLAAGQTRIVSTIFGRAWRAKDGSVKGSLWAVHALDPRHVEPYNAPDGHDLRELARCIDEAPKALA